MKKIFRVFSLFLVAALSFLFAGCENQSAEEEEGWTSDLSDPPAIEQPAPAVVDTSKDAVGESYYKNLPVIEISTQDNILPYDKETYINCSFEMSNCENADFNFKVDMKEEYGAENSVGIRLRGNSTMGLAKKPYRIKFNEKTSLLGLEKNKSWVLLADYIDQSAIRNYTAFSMAEMFDNLDFTPTPNHVVLFLNDEYQGLYLLTEQVDENSGRTGVKEKIVDPKAGDDFPFLLEMDFKAIYEGLDGVDHFIIEGLYPIEVKYPESDERGLTEGQEDVVFSYIYEYIWATYKTLKTGEKVEVSFRTEPVGFEDLVNENSFIDYHLLQEFMRNCDGNQGSIYMHKTKTGKLMMGPVWDFDFSCTEAKWLDELDNLNNFYKPDIKSAQELMIASENALFNAYLQREENFLKVQTRWNEVAPKFGALNTKIRNYKFVIESAAHADAEKWYGETGKFQFDMQYDYVRLFLIDRHEFLNKTFNLTHEEFLELLK